jgi:hypothetical protein
MSDSKVYIITIDIRQNDGSYEKSIDSVWATDGLAKDEFIRIAEQYNGTEEKYINWRAVRPDLQINNLSVEVLVDGYYKCKNFYSIIEKELQS